MTALYIHIPYCKSKCRYCDFASAPVDGSVSAYLAALAEEASKVFGTIRSARTIFVGGGTPTVLSPEQIASLFEHLRETFEILPDAEITVEANPCTLSPAMAAALAGGGVNRVSLGAQSFVDAELFFLGRTHEAVDISRSFRLLRDAGIGNINIDLIYAIPNQSLESWRYSLSRALELEPEHISAYCLTFEQATPLWHALKKGKIQKKSDEEDLALYEAARETLAQYGYEHYEISNFALPDKRSRHNMVYWSNDEYLGLGAGAVSYIGGERIVNRRKPAEYIHAMKAWGTARCEIERIPRRMQAVETIIQRLRLREGVDCAAFTSRFGFHPKKVFDGSFDKLIRAGLLEQTSDTLRASLKGWRLANEIALEALP